MTSDRLHRALVSGLPACAWIIRFDSEGVAEPGSKEDLSAVGEGHDGRHFWFHFDLSDARLEGVLRNCQFLEEYVREAFLGVVDHQFVEHSDNVIFGALIDHEMTISGRVYETDYLRFVLGPDYLLTARRKPLQSTVAARRQFGSSVNSDSPLATFDRISDNICDCVAKMTREIAAELDRIEDRVIFNGSGREQRAALGQARRDAVRLARQVGGLQSTLNRLEEHAADVENESLSEMSTRLAQRSDGLVRDVSNLQDRARVLQEEVNSILTLETNDRLYLLTIITTLILPATFVTGLFGMNTKQLFFSEDDNGTLYATLLCLLASGLALLILKKFGLTEPTPKAKGLDQFPRS